MRRSRISSSSARVTSGPSSACARRRREPHDVPLGVAAGIVDGDEEHEPVELRRGQRIGPRELDRVLGREHAERHRRAANRWPPTVIVPSSIASSRAACVFGGVRLISSASRMFVNAGPFMKLEVPLAGRRVLDDDVGARDVGGHEVRRELDAAEREVERVGDEPDEGGLREARNPDEEAMAAREDRRQDQLRRVVQADDAALQARPDRFRRPGPLFGGGLRRRSSWCKLGKPQRAHVSTPRRARNAKRSRSPHMSTDHHKLRDSTRKLVTIERHILDEQRSSPKPRAT